MGKEISIMVSAKDRYSDTVRAMKATTETFGKEAEGLGRKLQALDKAYAPLQTEVKSLEKAMKQAQAQYAELGDEASKSALQIANADYAQGKRNLQAMAKEIRQTERDMVSFGTESNKLSNRVGGICGTIDQLGKTVAGSQLAGMMGNALSGVASTFATSALGDTAGSAVNTVMASTASGAAMGLLAGPPGAAIGAGVGALAGGIQAGTEYFRKEDDEFRSVRQSEYDRVTQKEQTDLEAGKAIAAQREVDQIAFSSLMGGEDTAKSFLSGIKDMANTTPFLYDDLKSMSKVMSTYGYGPEEIQKRLMQIGDAGADLGLDASGMSMVATYLGRMNSTGKTTMEYLNPLMERGIPVLDYLSESLGKSKKEVTEMVSEGLVPGADAARIIADAMGEDHAGAMQKMSETYSGLMSTVQGLNEELQNAMGEGYTAERSKGLQEQVSWLDKNSKAYESVNRMIGEYNASLDNEREAKLRAAEGEALEFIRQNHITGAEGGRILKEAQVAAEIEYRNSEGYQLQQATEKQLVNNLGIALKDDYQQFGRNMKIEFNKGLASVSSVEELSPPGIYNNTARLGGSAESFTNGEYANQVLNGKKVTKKAQNENPQRSAPGAAYGLAYIPRDDYPVRLHEGERVLTAQENRAYNGNTGNIVINMSGTVVREEADVEAVARVIADKVLRAAQLL